MEVNGQLHAPVTFPLGEESPIPLPLKQINMVKGNMSSFIQSGAAVQEAVFLGRRDSVSKLRGTLRVTFLEAHLKI
jgi:hypothetical protein